VLLLLLTLTASADPTTLLVNYGLAGVVLALLALGVFRTRAEVDSLKDALRQEREDSREQARAMQALVSQITMHTLPQLTQTAQVVEQVANRTDPGLATSLQEITAKLAALEIAQRGGTDA
jgi:hypothetical protein